MRRISAATILTASAAAVAIWLSLGSLAVTDDRTSHRIGLLAPLWLLAVAAAATVPLLSRAARLGRAGAVALLSGLILLPWLPMPVPDAFLIWTGPMVIFIWIAVGLCALPPLLCDIDGRRVRLLSDARIAPRVACALAFTASIAVHARQPLPPVGDEPHYLLIAHSLLADHDFVVSNNYERRDYLAYYPGPLWPHYAPPAKDGSLYSLHGQGLPALIAPALAIGGYRAVVLWIAAIAALGTLFVWKAAFAITSDVRAAWVAWAAAALTVPVVLESTLVYPDAVAGTVLAAGVLAMIAGPSLSTRGASALGVGIGLLPWLHTRYAPLAAILAGLVALRLIGTVGVRQRPASALLGLGIPIVASVTGWLLFSAHAYGTFDPMAAYGGRAPLEPAHMVSGLFGLAADQEFGVIPNAPVHLLWIGGAWALWKHHQRLGIEIACVAVPYLLAVAAFPNWFGGSTPARYLTPLVFPLSIAVAPLWCRQDDFGRCLSVALLMVSVLIAGGLGFGASGMLAYNTGEGRSALLDWISPLVNLPGGFPSYFRAISAEGIARGNIRQELMLPAALWTMISIAIWAVARWIHHRSDADTVSRPALAGACVVGVLSTGVASTWAIARVPHLVAMRAQLGLIARENPRTSLGVQLSPLRIMSSADALQRLEISASPLDTSPAGVLLNLSEVPPGEYRLRLKFASEPRGEIRLSVGADGGPLESWDVSAPGNTYGFRLPIHASALTVVADPAAAQSIRSVALIPVHHTAPSWTASTRARAAVRYRQTVVYAIDNRVVMEPDGFWVLGGRQPDVVVTTDHWSAGLTLRLTNVGVPNRVRVSSGTWSATRELAPGERWLVTVPPSGSAQPAVVNFRVEQGTTVGGRFLGCHVTIVE